jgi:hypothetical protein
MATKATSGTDPTLRVHLALTEREVNCILAASRTMRVPTALLIWTAALEAAHVMGYCEGLVPHPRPRPGMWLDAPRRAPDETARVRMTVSVSPLHLRTLQRAAVEQLGPDYQLAVHGGPAPVHAFLIGTTLRFIATQLQRCRKTAASSRAEDAERESAERFVDAVERAIGEDRSSVLAHYLRSA